MLEFMARKRAKASRKIRFVVWLARPRVSQRRFAAGVKELNFMLYSEFVRWRLCRTNGQRLRERQDLLFSLTRPRVLQRRFAAARTE